MSWSTIMGVILFLYAGYALYKGRIGSGNDYDPTVTWITREKQPVQYWFSMALLLVMAVILLFNVFHF